MRLIIGRLGRPHGIRGELTVEVRTDFSDERFAPGTVLETDPAGRGPLTVRQARWHAGRLLVQFEGITDRESAEQLRGTVLEVDSDQLPSLSDPDEFYDHQLIGLTAVTLDQQIIGSVTSVIHSPAGDLLAIELQNIGAEKTEVLVPFVSAIVPTVDLAAGRVTIDPPEGLFEL